MSHHGLQVLYTIMNNDPQWACERAFAPWLDFEGLLLADASPGPGERIVVAPIDISALRHERQTRRGHHMLAHLRTEAYPVYRESIYSPERANNEIKELTYEVNNRLIDDSKSRL